MEDAIDTRKHFAVPMTVTVKVQSADEASELAAAIAQVLPKLMKGVSISHPPVAGVPQELGAVTLSDAEQASAQELGAMLDGPPEHAPDAHLDDQGD